jgi:hypothetical protein
MLLSVLQLVVLIHVIKLNIKIKIVKSAKFHVTSGVQKRSHIKNVKISRGVNTFSYGAFVSPNGGLGGPPSFLAC